MARKESCRGRCLCSATGVETGVDTEFDTSLPRSLTKAQRRQIRDAYDQLWVTQRQFRAILVRLIEADVADYAAYRDRLIASRRALHSAIEGWSLDNALLTSILRSLRITAETIQDADTRRRKFLASGRSIVALTPDLSRPRQPEARIREPGADGPRSDNYYMNPIDSK